MEDNLNPIPENLPNPVETAAPGVPAADVKPPEVARQPDFTARGRELVFGGITLLMSVLMCNFVLYGGFHLGFGLAAMGAIGCTWVYLYKSGRHFGWYEKALLLFSLLIAPGFGRSADGFVKFVMLLFLFAAVNLSFILAAGQNRRDPNGAMSLLDAFRGFYTLGLGSIGRAGSGLAAGFRKGGETTRKFGAVTMGLLLSVPLLLVMVFLLMSADAAFEGLMDLLPEFELEEYIQSALWGTLLGAILYSRGVSLTRSLKPREARSKFEGFNPLTVNTVLCMVCLVYTVYLLSQLAYFSGGLSGILPEEYTLAEYARRGFFEMAWLCAINLGILCCAMWLIRCEGKLPLLTRIAGAFIGAVTIFLVITASAKMFLYIGSYGLTRLRVLTEVIMLWLAVTTVLITVRLFTKLPYMKAVVLTAMVLGTLVFWLDVNTLVANYNLNAYRTGKLETIDVSHLGELGPAGIPALLELTEDADPEIAEKARDIIRHRSYRVDDFRDWTYDKARAAALLVTYHAEEDKAVRELMGGILDLEISGGSVIKDALHSLRMEEGQRFLRMKFSAEEDEAIREQMEAAGWEQGAVRGTARSLIYGGKPLHRSYRDLCQSPAASADYWILLDLHPDAQKDEAETIHNRNGYKFVLAFYEMDSRRLYFLEVDTLTESLEAA